MRVFHRKRAFTLVEMLVVLTIIGILAGLISAAVVAARNKAKAMAISNEIKGLETALETWRSKYGEYPPDFAGVNSSNTQYQSQAQNAVISHILKMCPRWNPGNSTNAYTNVLLPALSGCKIDPTSLDPSTALAFWLGGLPGTDSTGNSVVAQLTGFCTNPTNPFTYGNSSGNANVAQSRTAVFFQFDSSRLTAVSAGQPVQLPSSSPVAFQYSPDTGTASSGGPAHPYIYFCARSYLMSQQTAKGLTLNVTGFQPGYQMWPTQEKQPLSETGKQGQQISVRVHPYLHVSTDGKVCEWFNSTRFQIICAGLDGLYGGIVGEGSSVATGPHIPASDNLQGDGHYDNVTNFGVIENINK